MRPKRPRVEAPSRGVSRRPSGRAASPEGDALGDSDSEPAAGGRAGAEDEEDEEAEETAGEKRLRLAKAYLSTLRAELAQDKASKRSALSDEDEEGEEGEEGGEGDGALGQRLAADARQARGEAQRPLARRVRLPSAADPQQGTLWKGHSRPVTALALSSDDAFCVSAAKDGTLLRHDTATGQRTRLPQPPPVPTHTGPCAPPRSGAATVLALALSSDGQLLASGGCDKAVHVWDLRAPPAASPAYLTHFPGHRDAVTGLAFREGSRQLFSCARDRCVKVWSLDDMAYVDTLYGHGAEVAAIAASRKERVLTCGSDRTCRLWKVVEDSQLVFHAPAAAGSLESICWVSPTEWVTGATDGSLQRWSATRKKPAGTWLGAHGAWTAAPVAAPAAENGRSHAPGPNAAARKAGGSGLGYGASARSVAAACAASGRPEPCLGDAERWVNAVAAAPGSDLLASGAADGCIRLWRAQGGALGFEPRGGLAARGFVNALAVARSGRFLLAAVGQEHRLGRWARDCGARNGVLFHALQLDDEEAAAAAEEP